MKREHLAFLFGGLAFGMLLGFGLYHAVSTRPDLGSIAAAGGGGAPAPRGPQAPTQTGPNAAGGAPMVAEINRLKRMLQDEPQSPEVLLRLANLYHDAAMWEQAVGYYERAKELRADDPDLLTDLGTCYRELRQFDRAIEMFDQASALNPDHWQSLFNTAVVALFDVGRMELAVDALESLEAIEPRPPELAPRLDQLRRALERSRSGGETEG